jgi:hypothetical protein
MKNFCHIILFSFLIFSSCKKDDNTNTVTYKIIETTPGASPYSVRYSLSDGTLRSEGPITSEIWMTADMSGYKKNTIVSLYLDATSGTYDMIIYVNGSVSSQASADGGMGEQLLEAQIPN